MSCVAIPFQPSLFPDLGNNQATQAAFKRLQLACADICDATLSPTSE